MYGTFKAVFGPTSPRDYFTERKGVARGSMRLADNLSSCNLASLNTYSPVTSFLVHRRPFWVSSIPSPTSVYAGIL